MDPKAIAYYQALAREPSLAEQLPIVFDNGNRWTSEQLRARCQFCQKIFPNHRLTGRLIRQTPHMVQMDAIGFCDACRKVTACHYRLYDDQRFEGKNAEGVWTIWTLKPQPWWRRAWNVLIRRPPPASPH